MELRDSEAPYFAGFDTVPRLLRSQLDMLVCKNDVIRSWVSIPIFAAVYKYHTIHVLIGSSMSQSPEPQRTAMCTNPRHRISGDNTQRSCPDPHSPKW